MRRGKRNLGNMNRVKKARPEVWNSIWLEQLLQDIRYSLRTIRLNPVFALAVVVTLALGIGVNATMFSVIDALLFRMPDHVQAPQQLVRVFNHVRPPAHGNSGRFAGYKIIFENSRLLDLSGQFFSDQDFGRGADARRIHVGFVDASYLPLLGTFVQFGRNFNPQEAGIGRSAPVAILSYRLWQEGFSGDPHVLNREIWVGEGAYTVIGVMPRGFNGIESVAVDAWLPLADAPDPLAGITSSTEAEKYGRMGVIGRLHPGGTLEQAAAEADAVYLHAGADSKFAIAMEPYFVSRTAHLTDNSRISLWLTGIAFVVFLIACANVANLFLVRLVNRQHEMAVRMQLGASRGRLLRHVVVESMVLSAIGGAGAIAVLAVAGPLMRSFLLPANSSVGSLLTVRLLVVTAILVAVAGFASGIPAAWRASRPNLSQALQSGGRGRGQARSLLRTGLLVVQVALTVILTVGAGLFIHSVRNIRGLGLGFEPDRALFASLDLRRSGYQPADIDAAYKRLLDRLSGVPSIESAALTSGIPMYSKTMTMIRIRMENRDPKTFSGGSFEGVTPGYFAAMGTRILQGRDFLPTDQAGAPLVAIVSDTLARDLWPSENAIGQCMLTPQLAGKEICTEVVGVMEDRNLDVTASAPPKWDPKAKIHAFERGDRREFFVPLAQGEVGTFKLTPHTLVLRIRERTPTAMASVFVALQSAAPGARFVDLKILATLLDARTESFRLGAAMFSFFSGLALLLAAVGTYGVLAFLVRSRTAEIGIRMALGALPGQVMRRVLWLGMRATGVGLVAGVIAAVGLSRLVRGLLYGVAPSDLASYFGAAFVILAVTALACMLPAWRAARVDPATSLRHE
jgi:predicted permease